MSLIGRFLIWLLRRVFFAIGKFVFLSIIDPLMIMIKSLVAVTIYVTTTYLISKFFDIDPRHVIMPPIYVLLLLVALDMVYIGYHQKSWLKQQYKKLTARYHKTKNQK